MTAPAPTVQVQESERLARAALSRLAEPGDVLLLCTDGLDKHVDEPTIARLIGQSRSAEENCQALIDAAAEALEARGVRVAALRRER